MGKRTNTAVWLEKYNRWQIKVQKDGIRKTFTSSKAGRTGQREANKKADEWLDEGIEKPNEKISVLYEEWTESLKISTSFDNWKQNNSIGKTWILPIIGNKKVDNIKEADFNKIILCAHSKGRAKKTLMNIRNSCQSFLKYLRKNKMTNLRIEDFPIPKSAPKPKKTILQKDALTLLFSKSVEEPTKNKDEFFINAIRFFVVTGIRPGELIGLLKSDILNGYVTIQRSINVHKMVVDGGKNENAERSFKLTPTAKNILNEQEKIVQAHGVNSDYVFPYFTGEPIKYYTFRNIWRRIRERYSLGDVTLYELRHTFFSIAKTLPSELVKMVGGHSESMDTFGVYGHEMDGELDEAALLLEERLQNILADKQPQETQK